MQNDIIKMRIKKIALRITCMALFLLTFSGSIYYNIRKEFLGSVTMKRFLIFLISVLIIAVLAAGCSCGGSKNSSSNKTSSAVSETTKVLETTADGGTVEEDPEGNVITKDKNGEITSVKDKEGNDVNVDEYKNSHENENNSSLSGNSSSKTSSKTSSNSKSSSGSKSSSSSSSKSNEPTEGEIPTVVIDDEGIETAPELPDL